MNQEPNLIPTVIFSKYCKTAEEFQECIDKGISGSFDTSLNNKHIVLVGSLLETRKVGVFREAQEFYNCHPRDLVNREDATLIDKIVDTMMEKDQIFDPNFDFVTFQGKNCSYLMVKKQAGGIIKLLFFKTIN